MLFLVALSGPSKHAWAQIEQHWPNRNYLVSDTLAFVSVDGIATAGQVGNAIGLNPDPTGKPMASGMVTTVEAHNAWGYLPMDVIHWMRMADPEALGESP